VRILGHKIPQHRLKHTKAIYTKSQKEMRAEREEHQKNRNGEYFKYMVEESLTGAALGWAFNAPVPEILKILRGGLREAQFMARFKAPFDPGEFPSFLGVALMVQDREVTPWMLSLARRHFTRKDIEYSEAAYLPIEAMQSGGKAERSFPVAVQKFAASITPQKLIVNSRSENAYFAPLVALLEAIVVKDQETFDKAWRKEEGAWRKEFSSPARSGSSRGILDFVALGIGRIADK
jgi:hypothetical protein